MIHIKRIIILLMGLTIAISLVACGSDNPSQTDKNPSEDTSSTELFDFDSYKASISDSVASVYESTIILSNVAQYENNYWEALENIGGTITTDKIISSAMEWLESETGDNLESVQAKYDENANTYKAIIFTAIEGTEAEEIKEVYEKYFDAYISLYNLVITPSGSRDSFVTEYNTYTGTITDCKSKLDILLS